jgi:murein DD-endopeptidase MepM/ murein hydrolase activator NlpD
MSAVSFFTHGQSINTIEAGQGAEYIAEKNDANQPCISPGQYHIIEQRCNDNSRLLRINTFIEKGANPPALQWPLSAATGFADCGFHFIGAFVDQNTALGSIQDFNCENNTYDGHHGTDIAVWPYGFYKMEHNSIEIHAAAAGTIIDKHDGEFDRNCGSNNLTANYVIIQHADGSRILYWHMKNGAVTTVAIGQPVAAGDYLGIVGSSGSSSGPHLHFEVWAGNTGATYKDPYSGTCNLLNANTWWIAQRPHTEPAILKVSVNTTDLVMSTCPTTETPNESSQFTVPFQGPGLAPGYAKFYIFLREMPTNAVIDVRILNPNGSTFNNWTYTPSTFSKVSFWGWSKLLPATAGNYTFQATYNGVTCSVPFEITTTVDVAENSVTDEMLFFPIPTENIFTVSGDGIENGNYTFTLTNSFGQIILKETTTVGNNSIRKNFSLFTLSGGIYFLIVENEKSRTVKKIIKQN